MIKTVGLLPRMVGTSRAAFQDYYEKHHAPLALEHFPFTKYVRNHLQLGTENDIGFDTIGEFWVADIAITQKLMEGEVGEIMRADERKFMDQAHNRAGTAVEHHLRGSPRGNDQGQKKVALLMKRDPAVVGVIFEEAVKNWTKGLTASRVTVDFVTPWPGPAWPCEAIVWLWQAQGEIPERPPGVLLWHGVPVIGHESSPDRR